MFLKYNLFINPALALRSSKFIKNVFERGGNLLQNGILHFVFRFNQLSEIAIKLLQYYIFFSVSFSGILSF